MRQEIIDCDVVIQAGHEDTPDDRTGGEGPLGNEIDWTPVVANEAVRILTEAGVDAVKETAHIKVTRQQYRCKLAIFVHFDAPDSGESGPSLGYDHDSDADAADAWKALYKEYFPYNDTWLRDNATADEHFYYGFEFTDTSDAEFVVELGDLTSLRQAEWLKPRLRWLGQLLAYFVSNRIGKGGLQKPDPFVSLVSANQGRTSMERPAHDGGNFGSGKGSCYSQYSGTYNWVDPGDPPNCNALGVPDSAQGCAFYNRSTLGDWFVVSAPNGKSLLMPQTDIGPSPRTGRKIDISAHMAEAFGYTPHTFPTDSIFTWVPAAPPPGLEGLSPKQQAIQWANGPIGPGPKPKVPPDLPNNLLLILLLMMLSKDKLMVDGPAKMLLPLLLQSALGGTQVDINALLPQLLYPQLGLMPADGVTKPPAPSNTPVLSKPSVQLSVAGLGLSTILQALGFVGTPFGMGQEPTDIGTLATLVPIITAAIGATGGFGALANIALRLLSGFGRQTT